MQTVGKQPEEINTVLAQVRDSFLHISVVLNRGDHGARGAQPGLAQKQQGHRGASGGQTSSSSPVCRSSVGRRAGLGASHGTGFCGLLANRKPRPRDQCGRSLGVGGGGTLALQQRSSVEQGRVTSGLKVGLPADSVQLATTQWGSLRTVGTQQPHMSLVDENPTGASSVTLVARAAEDLDRGSQIGIKTKHCEAEVGKLVQWVRNQSAIIAVVAEIEKVMVKDANVCFGLGEASGHGAQ